MLLVVLMSNLKANRGKLINFTSQQIGDKQCFTSSRKLMHKTFFLLESHFLSFILQILPVRNEKQLVRKPGSTVRPAVVRTVRNRVVSSIPTHLLPVSAWVPFRFSRHLPPSKDTQSGHHR